MGKITKGSPESMLNAFQDKLYELDGMDIDSSVNASYDIDEVSDEEIVDWLSEHDQAYSDCQDYFGVDDLSEVDGQSIYDWICEHDRLFEDFMNHFGHRAVGVDDEYSDYDDYQLYV